MADSATVAGIAGKRNCDLIDGMDYLEACGMCSGEGEYEQTYTIGCGGGYYTMPGPCDYCAGTGIRMINGGKVSQSHVAQIAMRRAHLERTSHDPD